MFKRGRLIRDVFAYIGTVLALGGIGLLPMQYLAWRKTGVWPAMQIRTVFELMGVAPPQVPDTVLKLPLSVAMFTIGFVFIWIAIEIYELVPGQRFYRRPMVSGRPFPHGPNR
jgi:hypothetical protein